MRRRFGQIVGNESGSAIVMTAVSLPLMIGAAGLATDVTQWTLWKRQLQRSADSAAIAGAYALVQAYSAESAAEADLAKSLDMVDAKTVVENAPTAGPESGNEDAVRVALSLSRPLPFSSMFLEAAPTIRAESTAAVVAGGKFCVIALDERNTTAINATGNADLVLGCGIAANARGSKAIDLGGSSTVVADPIAAVGQIDFGGKNIPAGTTLLPNSLRQVDPFSKLKVPDTGTCNAAMIVKPNGSSTGVTPTPSPAPAPAPTPTPTPTPTPGASPAPAPTPTPGDDPKKPKKDNEAADLVQNAALQQDDGKGSGKKGDGTDTGNGRGQNGGGQNGGGQNGGGQNGGGGVAVAEFEPGCYSEIDIKGKVHLKPGVYVFKNAGDIKITSQADITGHGVTFVLTGDPVTTIDINGGAALNLSAPTDGDFAGILFYQDRRATDTKSNKINGNAASKLVGALYFPAQELVFTGSSEQATQCVQIVALRVGFSGNSSVRNTCDDNMGMRTIRWPIVRLVR